MIVYFTDTTMNNLQMDWTAIQNKQTGYRLSVLVEQLIHVKS